MGPGSCRRRTTAPGRAPDWEDLLVAWGLEDLRVPVVLAQRSKTRSVWHCSLRLAPTDPRLSDEQWEQVATDVMRRTGLDVGDGEGVRWVAVRHAEDHIHIAATLVRPDLRPAEPRNDYYRVAEACHAAETRYGLRSTAPWDRTAGRQPTRAEVEKADRTGLDEPARVTLRREVRAAADVTGDPDAFLAALRSRLTGGRGREIDDHIARACRRSWGASQNLSAAHHRVLRSSRALPRSTSRNPDSLRTMLTMVRLFEDLARLRRAQNRAAQANAALHAVTAVRRLYPAAQSGPRQARRPVVRDLRQPAARSR